MKTYFDHIYGDQENLDLHIVRPHLDLENSSETEALENGWYIYDDAWYQARIVRLDLSLYHRTPRLIKNHEVIYRDYFKCSEEYEEVYNKFLDFKNFKVHYKLNYDLNRSACIEVRKDNKLVAFTKLLKYDIGIESVFTVWDYAEPKLSIGSKIIDYEVDYAKYLGHRHLYIGPGYGEGGIYKSNFDGFEWWTGKEWSKDAVKYIQLCNRDSEVKTLEQLDKIYNA